MRAKVSLKFLFADPLRLYIDDIISEELIELLHRAARSQNMNTDEMHEDNIDGGWESVFVTCEEDYLIAMSYIATCHTFKRQYDFQLFNLERERNKAVDLLLSIL